jgi:hypothetical protein
MSDSSIPPEFIQWIDANIEKYTLLEMEEFFDEPAMNNYLGQIEAFKKVKEKILEYGR